MRDELHKCVSIDLNEKPVSFGCWIRTDRNNRFDGQFFAFIIFQDMDTTQCIADNNCRPVPIAIPIVNRRDLFWFKNVLTLVAVRNWGELTPPA